MALQKTIEYKTLSIKNAYHKIIGVDFHDEMIDDKKVYHVSLRVGVFINGAKETRIRIDMYPFSFENESDLNLSTFYFNLKSHEDFIDSIDV